MRTLSRACGLTRRASSDMHIRRSQRRSRWHLRFPNRSRMKRFSVFLGLCLASVSSLWAAGALSTTSKASAVNAAQLGLPAPTSMAIGEANDSNALLGTYLTDTREMAGSMVGEAGKEFTLLELVWGIDNQNRVCVARLVARDSEGVLHESNSKEIYKQLTTDTNDLRGKFMPTDGGEYFQVNALQFATDASGVLVVAYLESVDAQGTPSTFSFLGAPCCALQTAFPCSQSTCEPPGFCSGFVSCPCPSSGSCGVRLTIGCRGGCPGGTGPCTGVCSNSVFNCRCN